MSIFDPKMSAGGTARQRGPLSMTTMQRRPLMFTKIAMTLVFTLLGTTAEPREPRIDAPGYAGLTFDGDPRGSAQPLTWWTGPEV